MSDPPNWLRAARSAWSNTGARRPPIAIDPGPGQESVWDYPRPPVVVADDRHVVVGDLSAPLADTRASLRVLETASPPTFYLPPDDVDLERLVPAAGRSFCEWKGEATYLSVDDAASPIAWTYRAPFVEFTSLAGYVAFYPGRVACFVDGERVRAQAGGFYGGWITDEIVGPFKGEPGTGGW
jgi:uncharacterized protein (DUF427 family)